MATSDSSWYGTGSRVSRTVGRVFELACLSATAIGILSVFVLLLYVTNDALRPLTADTTWYLVFAATVLAPAIALAGYYYRTDEPAGEVAYVSTGLPVLGVLVAGGLFVLFVEILPIAEWFALALSLAAAGAALYGHTRIRPDAVLERTVLTIVVPILAVFGAPPVTLARLVGLPQRVVSLRELVLKLPYLPLPSLQLTATVTLPVAAIAGWWVWKGRENRRDALVAGGLVVAGALTGLVVGPLLGIGADGWVIVYTTTVVPVAMYAEGVLRRGNGVAGLAFPATLLVGAVVGGLLVDQLGAAGPEAWLDWAFLTSPTTRSAATAGIYPALVGSVMLLIVIVVATFPVGVGAAVYLEEYAPASGPVGKFITLVEINIANLAGVPSVVYGLLGLAVFIRFFQMPSGSIVVGGLAIGLLILPIIIISAQEAIRAVPDSQRQASYGMGATQWQTTRNVVLPEALPGIMTGTILALGRAIGETAPLLLIGMAASVREAPNGFFDLGSAMPRQIFSWAFEIEPAFRYGVLAAGVVTLLVVLLVMNASAIVIRNKYQRNQ